MSRAPKRFDEQTDYDLRASVMLIPSEFGGRRHPFEPHFLGQFSWQLADVPRRDWDAIYWFDQPDRVADGQRVECRIWICRHLKMLANGEFPVGRQFAIREGRKIVGIGVIEESRL
ncbi:EF-Tu C-terminal domain-related protein [Aeoliella mucimassa]|uniref:Elongation factor Tu n=1 Tax=Aeoliella mucimassa TaxID=2527972 RepID=A0A518AUR3_9BACT|nr:hypothetical protein [Aeoliella mucimassa]QDU58452.1 Elongation factor Tu [Aeoliella mucimassa]